MKEWDVALHFAVKAETSEEAWKKVNALERAGLIADDVEPGDIDEPIEVSDKIT